MKNVRYVFVLLVEFLVGFALLTLASGYCGWALLISVAVVWAALMALLLVKLKKTDDDKSRRKIKGRIGLVMLLPTVAAIVGIAAFVIVLSQYI